MADGLYPVGPDRLRVVLEQVDVMARLLEDLRTLSMAEAGVLPLDRVEVDATDAIERATDAFASAADAAGVALRTSAGEPVAIEADPVRLEQVLANLLMNAIVHTPRGGTVTVGAEADADGVLVTVRDTGAGIDARSHPVRVRPLRDVGGHRRDGPRTRDRETSGRGARRHDRGRDPHRGRNRDPVHDPRGGQTVTMTFPAGWPCSR